MTKNFDEADRLALVGALSQTVEMQTLRIDVAGCAGDLSGVVAWLRERGYDDDAVARIVADLHDDGLVCDCAFLSNVVGLRCFSRVHKKQLTTSPFEGKIVESVVEV